MSLALAVPGSTRATSAFAQDDAPRRLDAGRFTAVYFPQDDRLARTLLAGAARTDSFPWLPRPQQRVLIAHRARRAALSGRGPAPRAPEWGVALAFPESRRVHHAGSRAPARMREIPLETLRHELAHLALHERLGNLPPRWFDEGYASVAAREWRREEVLATNLALALRGVPTLEQLEAELRRRLRRRRRRRTRLSYRAVAELAALDPERGLTLFFGYWENGRNLDSAVRRAFGITLGGFEREFQKRDAPPIRRARAVRRPLARVSRHWRCCCCRSSSRAVRETVGGCERMLAADAAAEQRGA